MPLLTLCSAATHRRVSKRIHEALSGGGSDRLKALLFKSKVTSVQELAMKHEESEEMDLELQLHPLFGQLKFKCGQSYDEVMISDISGFRKRFKLSSLKARRENATQPALHSITLKSWEHHGAYGFTDPSAMGGPLRCNKLHRLEGKDGALTVEELLKGFIASLDEFCSECKSGFEHARFEGWNVKRITDQYTAGSSEDSTGKSEGHSSGQPEESSSQSQKSSEQPKHTFDRSEVLFERPIWGERE